MWLLCELSPSPEEEPCHRLQVLKQLARLILLLNLRFFILCLFHPQNNKIDILCLLISTQPCLKTLHPARSVAPPMTSNRPGRRRGTANHDMMVWRESVGIFLSAMLPYISVFAQAEAKPVAYRKVYYYWGEWGEDRQESEDSLCKEIEKRMSERSEVGKSGGRFRTIWHGSFAFQLVNISVTIPHEAM